MGSLSKETAALIPTEFLQRLQNACICVCCLTQHAGVQPASVLLSLQELKRSLQLLPSPRKDTANQLPYNKLKTILTHIFPSPICVPCPKVPGQVGKEGHTAGFDRVDVVYSRGFSRRPLPEVQTGATRITKCTEWFQCLK